MKKPRVNFMRIKPANKKKSYKEKKKWTHVFSWPYQNQNGIVMSMSKMRTFKAYPEYAPHSGEECRIIRKNPMGTFDVEFPDGEVLPVAESWLAKNQE